MPKKKIELEDLLKLKRSERPSAEDWVRFDADLKSKLLKSVVSHDNTYLKCSWLFKSASAFAFALVVCENFYPDSFLFFLNSNTESFVSRIPNLEHSFAENEIQITQQNSDFVNVQIYNDNVLNLDIENKTLNDVFENSVLIGQQFSF